MLDLSARFVPPRVGEALQTFDPGKLELVIAAVSRTVKQGFQSSALAERATWAAPRRIIELLTGISEL